MHAGGVPDSAGHQEGGLTQHILQRLPALCMCAVCLAKSGQGDEQVAERMGCRSGLKSKLFCQAWQKACLNDAQLPPALADDGRHATAAQGLEDQLGQPLRTQTPVNARERIAAKASITETHLGQTMTQLTLCMLLDQGSTIVQVKLIDGNQLHAHGTGPTISSRAVTMQHADAQG